MTATFTALVDATLATLTDSQIESLRDTAGQAGDLLQVDYCDRALDGDAAARRVCAEAIADAANR